MKQAVKLSRKSETSAQRLMGRRHRLSAVFFGVVALTIAAWQPQAHAISSSDTFEGTNAGNTTTTGIDDSGFGSEALHAVTSGNYDTATGEEALQNNTTGILNTGTGNQALLNNTNGGSNTATGVDALFNNTTGSNNTATGTSALEYGNASYNTATGYQTLENTTGSYNTATGIQALNQNSTGTGNVGNGYDSLFSNTTGNYNMGQGPQALYHNTTGSANCAIGVNALIGNTTGGSNIGIGASAGQNLTTGSGNIDIGNMGVAAEANTIRIGSSQTAAFMAGVHGVVASGGVAVYVTSSGQLGTSPSSRRFKEDIKPMARQSDALLSLKPVSFRYKKDLDPSKTAQFGLIAEEVAKVDPDLVARDNKGQIYSVRYEAINAMLLNEFLKEHARVEKMEKQINDLTAAMQKAQAKPQPPSAAAADNQ